MESRCKMGMGMTSTRAGRGFRLQFDGVQVLGYRGLLVIALLFVTSTTFVIEEAHCITTEANAPAPTPSTQTQNIAVFHQFEADALNAVFQKWSKQNPQLSTLLNWSPEQHPCNNLTRVFGMSNFEGAWRGVHCSSSVRNLTEYPRHYEVSVTILVLIGSNEFCKAGNLYNLCGFDGIIGELPSEISNLTNLVTIVIGHNPRLTGSVPVELFQMPNLISLYLYNNSLSGTLPSDVYNADCVLEDIYLSNNNFSGNLRVSSQGTLFCSSLQDLNVEFNQLDGPLDLQDWNGTKALSLNFSNNHFGGTFSTGPYFGAQKLDLSYNDFTTIQFANYIGPTQSNDSSIVYMPFLSTLNISNNNCNGPFPKEIFQMPSLTKLDLSMNHFGGTIDFRSFSEMKELYYMDLSMNHFGGSIDFGSSNVSAKLTYLNINNNNFNGTFSASLYHNLSIMDLSNNEFNDIRFHAYNETTPSNGNILLPLLKEIYFQNNNLSGQFPAEILAAPNLQILNASQNEYQTLQLPFLQLDNSNLSQVFITNNKLGEVQYPKSGRLSSYNLQFSSLLFLAGNPICDIIEDLILSSICRLNRTQEPRLVIPKSNTKMNIIIATSTSTTIVLILLATAVYLWRLMRRIKALHIILEEFDKKEVKPNLYSYREVKLATNNFDKDNKLGEGGFGVVYKGELFDGTQAAVKKLTMSSNQMLSEFLNEVIIISGLKHCNLVKLKGCCLGDGDQRILVFEYIENNNLAEALWMHGDLQSNIELPYLDWETRFNIIVGIARGLAYLHEELQPPIIHRDIKATNILLDKNYNAKIADFGLAYLFPTLDNEATHLTLMQVAGTRGYCSPEYALRGHVSTALDVYSFGILVLEIVSGRKNIDLQKPSEEIYLREWAWKQYEAKASMTLIDHKMEHSPTDLEAILRVIVVALACVDYEVARRPKMHNVVPMLFGNMSITQFQTSFEDGDDIGEMSVEFPITLGTTSSL